MQVTIAATSSVLDNNMVLIETSVTIGEAVTTTRAGYDKLELMDNRYLSGTFEERVEALRQSAERMTETSVKLHFQALAKITSPEALVTDVAFSGTKADVLIVDEVADEKPAKKTRKPRTPKAAQ
ncbi:hypothetical protein CHF33_11 [Pseudomonas phage CHF33]|uniref:Uncharacterized protein n=2 Tax=Ghunavirus TaxID=2732683 RepID=A0A7D0PL21_9CAUD|nr:hypothetical protein CHF1_11 [Pseudomonas phage CHF1]QLI60569.1 hypothetical protein CHF33_11 [Pseudomonas phage CHF33]